MDREKAKAAQAEVCKTALEMYRSGLVAGTWGNISARIDDTYMAITPSGNVVPCQSWLSEEPLGNILTGSWKKIWNSDRCKKIRMTSAKMEHICQLKN